MKKRLTAFILCLLMLAALLPAAVADGEPEEPVTAPEPDESEVVVIDEAEMPEEQPEEPTEQPEKPIEQPEEAPEAEQPEALTEDAEEDPDAVVLDPDEDIEATVYLINEKNFPDENFRKWIVANIPGVTIDSNGVCSIKKEDAQKVTSIAVDGQEIASLAGIGKFSNLTTLSCKDNKIRNLDVSALKKLETLDCQNNKIEKLKLGSTKKLTKLNCANNKLSSISLVYNTALVQLLCDSNKLTSLDPAPCTALQTLNCGNNQLKKLDVSKNTNLKSLTCGSNQLNALDVSKNTQLFELRVGKNEIEKLDLSKNVLLETFVCNDTKIKTIDLTKNANLCSLNVNSNALTALDVTKNTQLTALSAENNQLKSVDLTKNTELVTINLCGNALKSLNVKANTKLQELAFYENAVKTVDLTKNTELVRLNCGANALETLDLSQCTKLKVLDCPYNALKALLLDHNLLLEELYCYGNQLTELELGMLVNLKKVEMNKQERLAPSGIVYSGGDYKFDMSLILGAFDKIQLAVYPFNKVTGFVTLPGYISSFDYLYDTGKGQMQVTLLMPYNGTPKFEFQKDAVQYKGTTPYVVYNGKEQKPAFALRNELDEIIDPLLYTYTYVSNVDPGTAYINVSFTNTTNTATGWFKIYLPGTKATSVENVKDGILVRWQKVDSAGGYVIYRRAWSSTTNGWTDFKRWNNTTNTEWVDTKVYAGSRYQYGIKAYKTDPMDNYNLGIVGPLKTTVRITTRVLKEVNPYTNKLVVKWEGSKNFTGYELQYARDAAFTQGVKTIKINKASTYQTTINNLKSKTTYWVRIRSYHIFEGVTYFGQWSNVMSAKVR